MTFVIKRLGIKNINDGELFKTTGTWHLLCVGGWHMHLVKDILDVFFNCLGEIFKNMRVIRRLFLYTEICFLWGYAYMSNFHLPALRSILMSTLSFLFYLKGFSGPNLWIFFIIFFIIFLLANSCYSDWNSYSCSTISTCYN